MVECLLYQALRGGQIADIGLDGDRLPTTGIDVGYDGLSLFGALPIVDHHSRALCGQFFGDGRTDPARASRHNRDLAVQHDSPPWRRSVGFACLADRGDAIDGHSGSGRIK